MFRLIICMSDGAISLINLTGPCGFNGVSTTNRPTSVLSLLNFLISIPKSLLIQSSAPFRLPSHFSFNPLLHFDSHLTFHSILCSIYIPKSPLIQSSAPFRFPSHFSLNLTLNFDSQVDSWRSFCHSVIPTRFHWHLACVSLQCN